MNWTAAFVAWTIISGIAVFATGMASLMSFESALNFSTEQRRGWRFAFVVSFAIFLVSVTLASGYAAS